MSLIDVDQSAIGQFRQLPEIKPPLELFDGRVIQKVSPKVPHSYLQPDLCASLNEFARPRRLGRAGTELRCTFGGVSIVFDVSYYVLDRMPTCRRNSEAPDVLYPPDIAVEIISPAQTVGEQSARLRFATRRGTRLGWLIHPIRETLTVYRPHRRFQVLRAGDLLGGEDVIPGYELAIDELFGWLDPY